MKLNLVFLLFFAAQSNMYTETKVNNSLKYYKEENIYNPTQNIFKTLNGVKYVIVYDNYPDLMVNFKLKTKLNSTEINKTESLFKKNKKIYVSDFSENSIMLDFQTYTTERFKSDRVFLENVIKEICNLNFSKKIDTITVE
jgi:hypothetical protein